MVMVMRSSTTIIFGVPGAALAIAGVTLAYLQLRRTLVIHSVVVSNQSTDISQVELQNSGQEGQQQS